MSPTGALDPKDCWQTEAVRGLEASMGPFLDLWGYRQVCLLQDPCASKTVDNGWDGLEPNYRAYSESTV